MTFTFDAQTTKKNNFVLKAFINGRHYPNRFYLTKPNMHNNPFIESSNIPDGHAQSPVFLSPGKCQ